MNSNSIFLYVYQNRHGCRDKLEKYFKVEVPTSKIKKSNDDTYDITEQNSNPKNCDALDFNIVLPFKNVIQFADQKITNKN